MFPIEENIYMPQNEEQQKVLYRKILESFFCGPHTCSFQKISLKNGWKTANPY